jgi:3-oxoacyl-[acyl-carrier-protein] synthase-1
MIDRTGEPMFVTRVPLGVESMDGVARMVELAVPAAREAVATVPNGRSVELLLALPEARPGLPNGFALATGSQIVDKLAGVVAISKLKVKPRGHAAGVSLIGEAIATIAREPEKLLLVGGVDSWLVPETLEWLDSLEALHSHVMPWGFCPGEGAAFCLFGGTRHGHAGPSVEGFGEAMEANRIRTQTVCTGDGLSTAWRRALAGLAGTGQRVARIWCDLNSEPYRADEIAFSVLRTREHLGDEVDIITPADCWGDVGAAIGPLLLITAGYAAAKGYAPDPLSLVSASSEGGSRGALLLHDRRTQG